MVEPIIETKDVVKQYASHLALDHVSLQMPKGKITGLLGPNGAGKTSLIRIITQITRADSGIVLYEGSPLKSSHVDGIGYLPEERGLYKKMEVGEQLLYLAQMKGLSKQEAIKRCKMWVEKFEIASWWKKKIEELSKGMQQKVQFISTVIHEPQLIILDEPFTGFDPINANLIKDEILQMKKNGASIIFSTHRMESVEEMCDYIILINKSKKILEGSVQEVKENFRTQMFQVSFKGNWKDIEGVEVESQELIGNNQLYTIKCETHLVGNQLISQLMKHIEIITFQEKIPSMNDIFIQLVSENN